VNKLKVGWTFHYGGPSMPSGGLGLDFRFEVQPLVIGGVMYISTPASPYVPELKSTVTALEPKPGRSSGNTSRRVASMAAGSPTGRATAPWDRGCTSPRTRAISGRST
jgi:hypothetical protein